MENLKAEFTDPKINFDIFKKVHRFFSYQEMPFLRDMVVEMQTNKPLKGIKIIHHLHLTLSTICKLEPLIFSGATVDVAISPKQQVDPVALGLLKESGISVIDYDQLEDDYDVSLDCCAGLLHKVTPRLGAVELTKTGSVIYQEANTGYPVISIDDSELKEFETKFGTGDGFLRGLGAFYPRKLVGKKFLIFGYGKVGRGIIYQLKEFTKNIIVIDPDAFARSCAAADDIIALDITQREEIIKALEDSFCVITATGVKNVISNFFSKEDFSKVKFLTNMGSEDEYGDKFLDSDILFDKKPLNFYLHEPTKLKFLDPVFYAHNYGAILLVNQQFSPGFYHLPKDLDDEIIKQYYKYHKDSLNAQQQIYIDTILENVPGYLFWKDKNSIFLGCNQNFALAAGLKSHKDIVGKTDKELVWGKSQADFFQRGDKEVLRGHPKFNVEELQLHADGAVKNILVSKVPLKDANQNVVGVIGTYLDITDRKKQELELKQAKEKAEQSNKAKSDFLAVVSHELRTPLTGILGMVEILQSEKLSEAERTTYLDNVDTASKHLLTIINNILDFAKLNENKFNLIHVPFDLKDIFQKALDILEAKALEKGIRLTLDYLKNLPQYLLGDPKALLQVFINLIGNAIKFTEQGGVSIFVKEEKHTNMHITLQIMIRDTGIGIPANKLKKIFERFEQVSSVQKRAYGGTGLGLSVSQKLVELMGGMISVESQVDKGSTFLVTLTFALNPQYSVAAKSNSKEEKVMVSAPRNCKVLLVEDDALIQLVHQYKFDRLGCLTDIAKNGSEALALYQANTYDIAFVDIGLPDMTGNEVIEKIRAMEDGKRHLCVVALTAYSDEENRKRVIKSGADTMLSKPIDDDKLARIFKRYL